MTLRDHVTGAGVLLGSLLLVGPIAYAVVAVAVDAALSTDGVGAHPVRLAAVVLPLALALYTASEVAELELHGAAALWRGTRRDVLLRHAVLATVTLTGLMEAGWLAARTLAWVLEGGVEDGGSTGLVGTPELVGSLAVLVIVAVWGTPMVFGFGVREGYEAMTL